jgi:hypothetical protein
MVVDWTTTVSPITTNPCCERPSSSMDRRTASSGAFWGSWLLASASQRSCAQRSTSFFLCIILGQDFHDWRSGQAKMTKRNGKDKVLMIRNKRLGHGKSHALCWDS